MLLPIEVRIASVEIRDTNLVACIEILSPVNKAGARINALSAKAAAALQCAFD